MKITNFDVHNYKSIEKIENIKFNKINSFIGTNNAGKSNILKSFVFMNRVLSELTEKYTLVASTNEVNEEIFFQKDLERNILMRMNVRIEGKEKNELLKKIVADIPDEYIEYIDEEITIECQILNRDKNNYYQYVSKILVGEKELLSISPTSYKLMDEINDIYKENKHHTANIEFLLKMLDFANKQKTTKDTDTTKIAEIQKYFDTNKQDYTLEDSFFEKIGEKKKPSLGDVIDFLNIELENIKNKRTLTLHKNKITIFGEEKNEIDKYIFTLLEYITDNINIIYIDEKRNINDNDIEWAIELKLSPYQNDTDKIETLQNRFGKLLYSIDQEGQHIPLEVKPVKEPENPSDMYFQIDGHRDTMNGMGSQELIKILIKVLKNRKNRNNIICIEEPEIHIHAGLEKDFFQMIKKEFNNGEEDGSISLLTTHSTNFTEIYNQDTNVYLVKKDYKKKNTTINKIDGDKEEKIANELGIGLEGYLFKKLVIFVEGKTDKDFLLNVSEKLGTRLDNYNIGIYEMGGGRSISKYIDITDTLFDKHTKAESLLGPKDINFLFIIDRDSKTDEEVSTLQEKFGNKIVILKRNEIENYFVDKDLLLLKQTLIGLERRGTIKTKLENQENEEIIFRNIEQKAIQSFLNNFYKYKYNHVLLDSLHKNRKAYTFEQARTLTKETKYTEVKEQFKYKDFNRDVIFANLETASTPFITEFITKLYPGRTKKNINIDALIDLCQGKELISYLTEETYSTINESCDHKPQNDAFYSYMTKEYIERYIPEIGELIKKIIKIVK